MFPLRDVIPSRTTPWVTYSLIGAGICAFVAERLSLLAGVHGWPAVLLSPLTHHGWLALVANNTCLWIFGDNVEDRCGHARFLALYGAAGIAAALASSILTRDSLSPWMDASGAIAGLIAAYVTLFPKSLVLFGVFLIGDVDVIETPALLLVAAWGVIQLVSGPADIESYVVGVAVGVPGVWLLKRPERQRVEWWSRLG